MELNRITLKQVFTFIQESVRKHAQDMKANNDRLQEILNTMPPSNARTAKLKKIYEQNQKISKLNYELNALHINIFKLIQSNKEAFDEITKVQQISPNYNLPTIYNQMSNPNEDFPKTENRNNINQVAESQEAPIPDDIDATFKLTVEGKIALDTYHPYATNRKFLERMLMHYEDQEKYEECTKIVELQKYLSN